MIERCRRWYILSAATAKLQTASVACFQRKIQLSGFSAYLVDLLSKLIWINGVLLHLPMCCSYKRSPTNEPSSCYVTPLWHNCYMLLHLSRHSVDTVVILTGNNLHYWEILVDFGQRGCRYWTVGRNREASDFVLPTISGTSFCIHSILN